MGCSNSKDNNYNKMLDWMYSIPKETSIDSVKIHQPNFVIVHWNKPDTSYKGRIHFSVEPKNYYDILKMDNRLIFDEKGYVGRAVHK
jgi:hypothetical protein